MRTVLLTAKFSIHERAAVWWNFNKLWIWLCGEVVVSCAAVHTEIWWLLDGALTQRFPNILARDPKIEIRHLPETQTSENCRSTSPQHVASRRVVSLSALWAIFTTFKWECPYIHGICFKIMYLWRGKHFEMLSVKCMTFTWAVTHKSLGNSAV